MTSAQKLKFPLTTYIVGQNFLIPQKQSKFIELPAGCLNITWAKKRL